MQSLSVVILAAGQGTRMKSSRPKVLHEVAGKPMLGHVCSTALAAGATNLHIVYGHGGEQVRTAMEATDAKWALQAEQKGTGHAVAQAIPGVEDELVMVLYGDVPLVTVDTLRRLANDADGNNLVILTAMLDDPTGYGRIVRDDDGAVVCIVEQKDATEQQKQIREINTGMLVTSADNLRRWLGQLNNDNAQGEYYLTDIVAMAVADGKPVLSVHPGTTDEILGVNNREQLADIERIYQRRRATELMLSGVTLADPARIDIRGELITGHDVYIDVNAVFEGRVEIGDNVRIGANCVLKDVVLHTDVVVEPFTVMEQAELCDGVHVGPYARLRPGTVLHSGARIGNFVEVKKSEIGAGSKVNHLSYVGDATVGKNVNIGAGTITCNYDGANKYQTIIEDDVFVGSDSQLVAPVTIGKGATIGAGSCITKNAPAGELTLARQQQKTISGWQRPVKKSN